VWSCPPDAGVKPCETFRKATVANKPGTPGRARSSRKTIAQGMPDCLGCPVVACVRKMHSFLHARLAGAASIRHFLRPRLSRDDERCITRAKRVAGTRSHVAFSYVGKRWRSWWCDAKSVVARRAIRSRRPSCPCHHRRRSAVRGLADWISASPWPACRDAPVLSLSPAGVPCATKFRPALRRRHSCRP